MDKTRLEKRIIEEEIVCDYCDTIIEAGKEVFIKTYYDVDRFNEIILCSPYCLDEYECEEFINSKEYKQALDDIFENYGE